MNDKPNRVPWRLPFKMPERVQRVWTVCQHKGPKYWVLAAVFGLAGWAIGHWLERVPDWVAFKYSTYVWMQDLRGGPTRVPQPVLVSIDDDEYYGPELSARRPLRRDYLAKLITTIAAERPRLIALDVDLRSPTPDRNAAADFDDYRAENQLLFEALCAAQATTKIVISKAVYESDDGHLVAEPNIYDGNSACAIPGGRISAGYLALAFDLRQIPLSERLADGTLADSFSLAVARALSPRQYPAALEMERLPYARFHSFESFRRLRAGDVIRGDAKKLQDEIAIIYGEWHLLARDRGYVVDTSRTPIGTTSGAFVHANLIDTLLNAEYSTPVPEAIIIGLEAVVALALAVAFAFPIGLGRKAVWLVATASLLFVANWLFFQVFAVFFDILPILVAIYLHAVFDQVEEWRQAAHRAEHGLPT